MPLSQNNLLIMILQSWPLLRRPNAQAPHRLHHNTLRHRAAARTTQKRGSQRLFGAPAELQVQDPSQDAGGNRCGLPAREDAELIFRLEKKSHQPLHRGSGFAQACVPLLSIHLSIRCAGVFGRHACTHARFPIIFGFGARSRVAGHAPRPSSATRLNSVHVRHDDATPRTPFELRPPARLLGCSVLFSFSSLLRVHGLLA